MPKNGGKYSGNDRYMGMVGGKSQKIMKDHGNTTSIETTSPQKFDMGRVNPSKMEKKGYSNKAFDYKY
jgi:hypothetical protein